jgi:hypothetical protein
MVALVWAVDVFFLLDVFVTFCTPAMVNGHLVHSRRNIALIYLSFYFWMDICAAIPFDRFVFSHTLYSQAPAVNTIWTCCTSRYHTTAVSIPIFGEYVLYLVLRARGKGLEFKFCCGS